MSAPNRKDAEAAIAFVRKLAMGAFGSACTACSAEDATGDRAPAEQHGRGCARVVARELARGFAPVLNRKPVRGPLTTAEKQLLVHVWHEQNSVGAGYRLPGDGGTGRTLRTAQRLERRRLVVFGRPVLHLTGRGEACFQRARKEAER